MRVPEKESQTTFLLTKVKGNATSGSLNCQINAQEGLISMLLSHCKQLRSKSCRRAIEV